MRNLDKTAKRTYTNATGCATINKENRPSDSEISRLPAIQSMLACHAGTYLERWWVEADQSHGPQDNLTSIVHVFFYLWSCLKGVALCCCCNGRAELKWGWETSENLHDSPGTCGGVRQVMRHAQCAVWKQKENKILGHFMFFVVFVKTVSVVLGSVMCKYRVIIWH